MLRQHRSDILQRILVLVSAIMLVPALIINLGLNPFFAVNDEAIRILVALEMHLSGDWLTPTTMGELYLNKPPLYNWLILISSLINGEFSEFSSRIVSVLSTLFFAVLVYHFSAKHISRKHAVLLSLAFVTNGRLLFFDSFLGLIDIAHGAVIFWAFMLIYHYFRKNKLWLLFLASYFLIAVAYLMKGLPAIVFQGITLLVLFTYQRQFRKLFHPAHFAGIALFLIIVGGYYLAYLNRNSLSFNELFTVLFEQSAKRTTLELGIGRTIGHIFSFPFEFLYHFAPWTLMVVLLFRKGIWQQLMRTSWLKFNTLIFLANILVYWVSPGVFARYFFMLVPLMFTVLFQLYFEEKNREAGSWRIKVVEYGFMGMMGLSIIGLPVIPFTGLEQWVRYPWALVVAAMLLLIVVLYLMWKTPSLRLPGIVIGLLTLRIVFNFFILPERAAEEMKYKDGAIGLAEHAAGQPLYIHSYNGLVQESDAFYISNQRQEILRKKYSGFNENELYLMGDVEWEKYNDAYEEVYKYACKWYDRPIRLVRMKPREE